MDAPIQAEVDLREQHHDVSPALLARFLGLGVALDLLVHRQWLGLGVAIFGIVFASALRSTLRSERPRERDALLLAACVCFGLVALRASGLLAALNLLAGLGLLVLAATRSERGVLATRVEDLVRRTTHVLLSSLVVPAAVLAPAARILGRRSIRTRALLRWAAIVLPVLAVFVALLASADRVFGSLVLPGWPAVELSGLALHVSLVTAGVVGAATLWLAAARPVPSGPGMRAVLPRVRSSEWMSVLVGIDVLFAVFVVVQLTTLFGGQRTIDVTEGLTYAEYARSGFFQLIAVAGLTVLVIMGGWDPGDRTERHQQRWFRVLVTVMIGLTGVILASALMRLALYEQAFGFTMERLAGYGAIAWIAIVLAGLLTSIWLGARERVIAVALIAGLAVLVGANALDAERFVAERNVARFEATGKIDVAYLGSLGQDATAVLVRVMDRLPKAQRIEAMEFLCTRAGELQIVPDDWRSANLGRAAARAALARARITPDLCP